MSITEKVKTIDNKIVPNKTQYDKQTAKISALSSGNASKYDFLTKKDVLQEKDVLEKAAALKRYEYSRLVSALKTQTSVAEKQCQGLNQLFKPDEKEESVAIKNEK